MIRRMQWGLLVVGLTLFGLSPFVAALELPSTEARCINDHGGLLSKADESKFKSLCDKARKDGVQMMIVTVKSLDDYSVRASRLDFFVDNLFDEWDIEYDAASSAILVFASRKERQVRLRMGDHYPDKAWKHAERIVKRNLGPSVARRSSAGIRKGMADLYGKVAKPYIKKKKRAEQEAQRKRGTVNFDQ